MNLKIISHATQNMIPVKSNGASFDFQSVIRTVCRLLRSRLSIKRIHFQYLPSISLIDKLSLGIYYQLFWELLKVVFIAISWPLVESQEITSTGNFQPTGQGRSSLATSRKMSVKVKSVASVDLPWPVFCPLVEKYWWNEY